MGKILYQAHTEPVSTSQEIVTESRWHAAWSEPVRQKINPQLAIALIASGLSYTPFIPPPPVIEAQWHQAWSEPVRVRPFNTALQQVGVIAPIALPQPLVTASFTAVPYIHRFAYQVYTAPVSLLGEAITEDKWHQAWSEPIVKAKPGLRTSAQQTLAFTPAAPFGETIYESKWHFAWSEPIVKAKAGLRTGSQQTLAFSEVVFTEQTTESRWHYPWSEPVRTRRLPIALQQQYWTDIVVKVNIRMAVTEQPDVFAGVLVESEAATDANVDIVEIQVSNTSHVDLVENQQDYARVMVVEV